MIARMLSFNEELYKMLDQLRLLESRYPTAIERIRSIKGVIENNLSAEIVQYAIPKTTAGCCYFIPYAES